MLIRGNIAMYYFLNKKTMKSHNVKIQTQNGLILSAMFRQPRRWFLGGDFCGGDVNLPFLGYKAPTRLSEMQKEGFVESRWSNKKTALGGKLKEYRLSLDRFKVKIDPVKSEVVLQKKFKLFG